MVVVSYKANETFKAIVDQGRQEKKQERDKDKERDIDRDIYTTRERDRESKIKRDIPAHPPIYFLR